MDKKKIIIVAVAIAALGLISFLIFRDKEVTNEDKQASAACGEWKEQVIAEIGKMNTCLTANDCVLVNGCPYGCNNLINKDADWSSLSAMNEGYTEKCGECTEICSGAFRPEEIACEAGKCISKRQ